MSNSLDPDQALHYVRPDLGPNCLQRLSADDTGNKDLLYLNSNVALYSNVDLFTPVTLKGISSVIIVIEAILIY